MSDPLVSIVIPSYNKPHFLIECLRSVLAQSYSNWECVVVSDGSPYTRLIRDIVESLKNQNISVHEHERNRGLAAARNTGARASSGHYLMFVDEDDLLHEKALETSLNKAVQADADIVCIAAAFIGIPGKIWSCPKNVRLQDALLWTPFVVPGCLIRRNAFNKVGPFDEHPTLRLGREDHEWAIRVLDSNLKLVVTDEVLYYIRPPQCHSTRDESLNVRAMKSEVKIAKYIISKHKELYFKFPEIERKLIALSYRKQAAYFLESGCKVRAIINEWQFALTSFRAYDFVRTLRRTLEYIGL